MDIILNALIIGCAMVAMLLPVAAFAIGFAFLATWGSRS